MTGLGFGLRSPDRLTKNGDDQASRVPGEPFCTHALLSDPGGTRYDSPSLRRTSRGRHAQINYRLPLDSVFRGSITRPTHSLSTLRSAGHPDATQDSLLAGG